jgi:hypothetical protein
LDLIPLPPISAGPEQTTDPALGKDEHGDDGEEDPDTPQAATDGMAAKPRQEVCSATKIKRAQSRNPPASASDASRLVSSNAVRLLYGWDMNVVGHTTKQARLVDALSLPYVSLKPLNIVA